MYIYMPIVGLAGAIPALLSREWAYKTCKLYCVGVFWLARVLCGLTYEVRGTAPKGSAVLAAKHQSFFDVMVFFYEMDKATFVMKKELRWAPILGFYAAVLAQRFDRPCVPAATNIGVFWPKRGFYRKPGVAVIEFLDPLPEGLSVEEMTEQMEHVIESNSNRLMAEAGFDFGDDQNDQNG